MLIVDAYPAPKKVRPAMLNALKMIIAMSSEEFLQLVNCPEPLCSWPHEAPLSFNTVQRPFHLRNDDFGDEKDKHCQRHNGPSFGEVKLRALTQSTTFLFKLEFHHHTMPIFCTQKKQLLELIHVHCPNSQVAKLSYSPTRVTSVQKQKLQNLGQTSAWLGLVEGEEIHYDEHL